MLSEVIMQLCWEGTERAHLPSLLLQTKNGVLYSVPLFKTKCKVLADAPVITAGKVYAGLIIFVFE